MSVDNCNAFYLLPYCIQVYHFDWILKLNQSHKCRAISLDPEAVSFRVSYDDAIKTDLSSLKWCSSYFIVVDGRFSLSGRFTVFTLKHQEVVWEISDAIWNNILPLDERGTCTDKKPLLSAMKGMTFVRCTFCWKGPLNDIAEAIFHRIWQLQLGSINSLMPPNVMHAWA